MVKLLLSPMAQDDLRDLRAYIEQETGGVKIAAEQVSGITKKLRLLKEQPQMGPPLTAVIGIVTDYRYLVCGSYYAFYKHVGDTIYVIRILHCARDFMRVLFGILEA
ncbi:MAG: type II toxin-antitoxin system RelE/ParE family toxin [Clostridiales bacterium]|nr:type II toxin-antitoxin system RelE/ParE family toxin [Clostridiales bacterium]